MRQQQQLNNLLFGSQCQESDYPVEALHSSPAIETLLDQQADLYHKYYDEPVSSSDLPNENQLTDRRHYEQQSKIRFAQVTAASVEFSHSQFNLSKHGGDKNFKSPIKTKTKYEDELRRRDQKIDQYNRIFEAKKKQDQQVDLVLDKELSTLAEQLEQQSKEINKKDALIDGFKRKVVQLETELEKKTSELSTSRNKQQTLQRNYKELLAEKDACLSLIDQKDEIFGKLKIQLNEALQYCKKKEDQVSIFKNELVNLRNQLDLYGLSDKYTRDLNIDRDNSKRSLTMLPDKADQMRRQLSTKSLLQQQEVSAMTRQLRLNQKMRMEADTSKLQEKLSLAEDSLSKAKRNEMILQQACDDLTTRNEQLEYDIKDLQRKIEKKEIQLREMSKCLQERLDKNNRQSKDLTRDMASLNQIHTEATNKLSQYEKRFKVQGEQLRKKEDRIKQLLLELADKNKSLQEASKSCTDFRSRLEVETHKQQQSVKEIKIINDELAQTRKKLKNTEKMLQQKTKSKKQQDRIEQLKNDVIRLEREAQQKETNMKELRKKVDDATKKVNLSKNRMGQLEHQLSECKADLAAQRQSTKRSLNSVSQLRKKAAQAQILTNKVRILETRLESMKNMNQINSQNKETLDLNDKVQALQEMLRQRDNEIDELKDYLTELQNQREDKPNMAQHQSYASQQRSYHLPPANLTMEDLANQIERLRCEIQEKDILIQNYRREVEHKEKSLEYIHGRLLKAERQKLQMEAEARIFQSNFYDSTDSHYFNSEHEENSRNTLKRQQYENKIRSLEERNKQLETRLNILDDQIAQQQIPTQTNRRNGSSSCLPSKNDGRESCAHKIQALVLKNRVKQLIELLNSRASKEANKMPPESLSPEETLQFLIQTMRRVSKSGEMIRLVSKTPEFVELVRSIERRRQEATSATTHARRLYA